MFFVWLLNSSSNAGQAKALHPSRDPAICSTRDTRARRKSIASVHLPFQAALRALGFEVKKEDASASDQLRPQRLTKVVLNCAAAEESSGWMWLNVLSDAHNHKGYVFLKYNPSETNGR